jgi:hypothetical protein
MSLGDHKSQNAWKYFTDADSKTDQPPVEH